MAKGAVAAAPAQHSPGDHSAGDAAGDFHFLTLPNISAADQALEAASGTHSEFIKKAKKTPPPDLALARKRQKEIENG